MIKLVYFLADNELRKVGRSYKLAHFYQTYGRREIVIHGYSIKGSKDIIQFRRRLQFDDTMVEKSLVDMVEELT